MQSSLKYKIILLLLFSTLLVAKNTIVHSWSIVNMNMDYKEYNKNDIIKDSEKSDYMDIKGIYYDIGYILNKKSSYDKISFSILSLGGKSKYKGSIQDSSDEYESLVNKSLHTIIDAKFAYNHVSLIGKSLELSGGIGIGYRYWDRILSKSQSEVYKWFSIRPNVGVNYNIDRNLFLKTSLEYQYGIDPVMIYVEKNDRFLLSFANILQADVALNFHIANKLNISLQYTYEGQESGESNVVNRLHEPDSTAKNQYIKIGITKKY
jgi:hypothetical protein